MGNDAQCKVVREGTIKIKTHDEIVRTLTSVRYVPELKQNHISLGTLESHGCRYSVEGGVLKVSKGAFVLLKVVRCDSLYVLQGSTVTSFAAVVSPNKDNTKLWHMRLGHMSEKRILILKKKDHLGNHCTGKVDFCKHCILGKQKNVSFSKAICRTKGTLDYIHLDLWGSSKVPSRGKCRYMMTIIDDFSRKQWVYFLKYKNEAFSTFKEWKLLIENQTDKKIKRLKTDNGLELCWNELNDFCKKEGISRHLTISTIKQGCRKNE